MHEDIVLETPSKKAAVDKFIKMLFGDQVIIQLVEGKKNIEYDLVVHNTKLGAKKVEIKTRYPNNKGRVYDDIAVEITQYERESQKMDDLIYQGLDGRVILERVGSFSKGWFFKSKPDYIIYITPKHIDVIDKNKLRDYVFKYSDNLIRKRKYSGLSTGSYNFIIPYNQDTKKFIARWENMQELTSPIYN